MSDTTDLTDNSSTTPNSPMPPKPTTFYRSRRVLIPLFVGFATCFIAVVFETGYPVIGFLTYILTGLFLDWWYFEYKKYKDSDQISEQFCQSIGITGSQIDQLNAYLVKARKASCGITIAITAASTLFSDEFNWQVVFMLSYIATSALIACIGMVTKKIIFPYKLDKAIGAYTQSNLIFNPLYSPKSNYSINFKKDSFDRLDITSSAAYWPGGVLDPRRFD